MVIATLGPAPHSPRQPVFSTVRLLSASADNAADSVLWYGAWLHVGPVQTWSVGAAGDFRQAVGKLKRGGAVGTGRAKATSGFRSWRDVVCIFDFAWSGVLDVSRIVYFTTRIWYGLT